MGSEVDFLSAEKHKSLLHDDSITLGVRSQTKSTENNQFTISLQNLKKNGKDTVIFCLVMNVKGSFKVILSFQVFVARHVHISK